MDYSVLEKISKVLQSNVLLYAVLVLFVLKIGLALLTISLPHNIFFADITRSNLQSLVNETRRTVGLKPLAENVKLDQAAQLKAQNMVQNQYFSHTSPSGITPWYWFLQAGYNYKYAGENLAIGFYDSQEVYDAWLNSASHKANIVNPNYTEVGTAVLKGFGQGNSIVVVQEFGSQKIAVKPSPVKTTAVIPVKQPVQTQSAISLPSKNVTSSLPAKLANSVLYDFDAWLQDVIYGVTMVVIGILITLIIFNFKINFKKELVFRAGFIVILLVIATAINKDVVIALIPHQILI